MNANMYCDILKQRLTLLQVNLDLKMFRYLYWKTTSIFAFKTYQKLNYSAQIKQTLCTVCLCVYHYHGCVCTCALLRCMCFISVQWLGYAGWFGACVGISVHSYADVENT